MSNLIDRAIGYFNPLQGLRRHHLRQMLARAYEGANQRDGWRPRRAGASANADHAQDARTLRIRSRALMQNVPYMAQGLRSLVASTIGTGITPNWQGPNAKKLSEAWNRWVSEADADGRQDYYGLQATAYRAMEQDGEVLIRLRWRRITDGLTVPLQLQLLEIDWLDSTKTGTGTSGNSIVNGIEYDNLGRIQGYWLLDQHPGDQNTIMSRVSLRASSRFIPASQILHLYTLDRPGQGRGFPRASPVIARVRDLQVYEDAELARKNLESRLSVLASGDLSQFTTAPDSAGELPKKASDMGELAGGALIQLPPGMTTTVVEPKAAPGYTDYTKWQLHLIASGFGVPYEAMTGDMSEVNFSSARIRSIDYRREVEMTQWTNLVPRLCNPVCRAFEDAAVLAGIIAKATYQLDHATPKWDYVNPAQEVAADLDEISGGLSSISEKLRRRGYKPEAVFQEISDDFKRLQELGVLDMLTLLQKGRAASEVKAKPA